MALVTVKNKYQVVIPQAKCRRLAADQHVFRSIRHPDRIPPRTCATVRKRCTRTGFSMVQTSDMTKNKHKHPPKTVLKLPDLGQSKSAVPNSLTSTSSQRSYDHTIRIHRMVLHGTSLGRLRRTGTHPLRERSPAKSTPTGGRRPGRWTTKTDPRQRRADRTRAHCGIYPQFVTLSTCPDVSV